MKVKSLLFVLLFAVSNSSTHAQPFSKAVVSHDNRIQATIMLNEKEALSYKVRYQGKDVISLSQLGLQLRGFDLTQGLKRIGDGGLCRFYPTDQMTFKTKPGRSRPGFQP